MLKVAILAFALGGCASFEEGWSRAAAEQRAAQQARYDAELTQRCAGYGFPPERIPDCKMQLDAQMRASAQQTRTNCVVRTYTHTGPYAAARYGAVEQRLECY